MGVKSLSNNSSNEISAYILEYIREITGGQDRIRTSDQWFQALSDIAGREIGGKELSVSEAATLLDKYYQGSTRKVIFARNLDE